MGSNNTLENGSGLYFVRGHDGIYTGEAYFEDNLIRHIDGQTQIKENDHLITRLEEKQIWPENYIASPVQKSVEDVLRTAGARAGDWDATDAEL